MDLRRRVVPAVIQIDLSGLRDVTRGIETDIGMAATGAMRGTTRTAVRDLRRQITDAGMSQRLANTWRDRVYPERRTSMVPTGYIWSNAPDIINAFASGATIRPVNGARYLWIPTSAVPRGRGSGRATSTKRMTPDEVERTFNAELVIRPGKQRGTLLAFLPPPARRNGRTRRPAGAGQKVVMKLMFVLRSSVKLDKVLDLDSAADRWAADYSAAFAREMGD